MTWWVVTVERLFVLPTTWLHGTYCPVLLGRSSVGLRHLDRRVGTHIPQFATVTTTPPPPHSLPVGCSSAVDSHYIQDVCGCTCVRLDDIPAVENMPRGVAPPSPCHTHTAACFHPTPPTPPPPHLLCLLAVCLPTTPFTHSHTLRVVALPGLCH